MKIAQSFTLVAFMALAWCAASIAQEPTKPKDREDQFSKKKERVESNPGVEEKRLLPKDKLAAIKERIQDLRRAGQNEEADKLQSQVTKAYERKGVDKGVEKRAEAAKDGPEKLKHLREAIEHLRQAGFKEQAESLEPLAIKMRTEFESKRADSPKGEGGGKEHDQVQSLRRELDQTRDQMKQMMQELREVRALVQKSADRDGRKE
jgi:hypothetical protein